MQLVLGVEISAPTIAPALAPALGPALAPALAPGLARAIPARVEMRERVRNPAAAAHGLRPGLVDGLHTRQKIQGAKPLLAQSLKCSA